MGPILHWLALALSFAATSAAAPRWVLLRGEGVEVCSNAGEKAAREALAQFEKARLVFSRFPFGKRAAPLPVRIYLFAGDREFAAYRRGESTEAFFQSGPEWDFIAARHNSAAGSRVILHEYTHLALSHASPRLPKWFEEGLAEFYSTAVLDGARLRLGEPVAVHLRVLASRPWLSPAALAGVDANSPEYDQRAKVGVFYAQSWALVHMLHTSPAWRGGLNAFFDLLLSGAPPAYAFRDAFGRPFEEAAGDLPRHLRAPALPAVILALDAAAPPSREAAAEALEPSDAELLLADLAFQTGRFALAEAAYRKLAASGESARLATRLGALALRLGRKEDARAHLSRAITLGSREAMTYFEYAVLLGEENGRREEIAKNLERAAGLNPNFAEAHFLLGNLELAAGRAREAAERFLRAAEILPRQAVFWHAAALALHETGETDQARRAAFRARDAAADERETEMAEAAIRLVSAPRAAPPADTRPAVSIPKSWENPRGDRRAQGTLRRIDCLGAAARFHLESEGRPLKLYVSNPGEVLLRNASSVTFDFRCGEQKPLPVEVEYREAPDAATGTAGILTAIEFR